MNELIKFFYVSVISAIIGGVALNLMYHYLKRRKEFEPPPSLLKLKLINEDKIILSLIKAIFYTILVNFIVSGLVEFLLIIIKKRALTTREIFSSILSAGFGGFVWGNFYFFACGAIACFFFMLRRKKDISDVVIFITSGFLAGTIFSPLGTISFWFIGENLLEYYSVSELYSLHPMALLRLYIPVLLYPIGYGIIASYILLNLGKGSKFLTIHKLRFRIFFVMILIVVGLFSALGSFMPNNFVWRALTYQRVFLIWGLYFLLFFVSFLVGTVIFERYLTKILFKGT